MNNNPDDVPGDIRELLSSFTEEIPDGLTSEYGEQLTDIIEFMDDEDDEEDCVMTVTINKSLPGNSEPISLYTANLEEGDFESVVRALIKQLPKSAALDVIKEVMQDLQITDEDAVASLKWSVQRLKSKIDQVNKPTIEYFKLMHNRLN